MCSASQQVAWDEVILAGFKLKLLQNMNATCATAAWLFLCFYPFVKKCYLKKILLTLILCHCNLKIAGSYRSQDQRGEWLFCQTWSCCNDSVVYCFYRTSLLFSLSCKLAIPRSLVTCCLLPKTIWETINSSFYPSLSVINRRLAYFQFYSFELCYYKIIWDFLYVK